VPPPGARVTVAGHDTERAEGARAVRVTVPEKPNRLAKLTVLVVEELATKDTTEDDIL